MVTLFILVDSSLNGAFLIGCQALPLPMDFLSYSNYNNKNLNQAFCLLFMYTGGPSTI
jgi:hypothetical protein